MHAVVYDGALWLAAISFMAFYALGGGELRHFDPHATPMCWCLRKLGHMSRTATSMLQAQGLSTR